MSDLIDQILSATQYLQHTILKPTKIGIITGSGLDRLADFVMKENTVPYKEIPGFPTPTVPFQAAQWITGKFADTPVVVMNGRFHYYEGHSMQEITLPVRVMHQLGVETLLITHAAGSMQPHIDPGSYAVVNDHINLMGNNALMGPHTPEKGERFPDMSDAYTAELVHKALQVSQKHHIRLFKTTLCAISGPSLPTPAEVIAYQRLGADTIGMSVVPEALTARQLNMRVLTLSAVTDRSLPGDKQKINRKQVAAHANKAVDAFNTIFSHLVHMI